MLFNSEKMLKLKEEDSAIRFMIDNLIERGNTESDALEVTFNSQVLDDSAMERAYTNA